MTHEPVPHVEFADWLASWQWKQGEHVGLVGPTGCGKSTFARAILPRRRYIAVVATKPKDATLKAFAKELGAKVVTSWPPPPGIERAVLWPPLRRPSDVPAQAAVIHDGLGLMFAAGGWCVYLDEDEYIEDQLRCKADVRLLLKQGRSLGLSIVAGNQRPRWVAKELWTEATHLGLWRTTNRDDLRALGELAGLDNVRVRDTVAGLAKHDVLVLNTRTGELIVTRPPTTNPTPIRR